MKNSEIILNLSRFAEKHYETDPMDLVFINNYLYKLFDTYPPFDDKIIKYLDKIDVSVVAAKFGGGGHKNASGMSCNGRVETLIPQIVKEFARIM